MYKSLGSGLCVFSFKEKGKKEEGDREREGQLREFSQIQEVAKCDTL